MISVPLLSFSLFMFNTCVLQLCLILCDPMAIAHQTLLTMGFSRQKYWSGPPFLSSGGLPDPEIEPTPLALAGGFFITSATWEAHFISVGASKAFSY